ncbi:hypothetical protein PEL8287_00409 [Roseovarius litorisediminis]|uniref:Uncharacterized protein n=1 Tax=Roseovarius litorisediminis TaxID=1312363 RepID=A0A1Y5RB51_9RHOB|nr:DUF6477 family protein [Roseovarius litorisediminis]SLN12561.1 hypothetical protein PEL8287_00409 [Roseovarius litorisediminis]
MNDILTMLDSLRRPRLLIRAARFGAAEYRRDSHLRRHLGYGRLPRSGPALLRLIEIESELNNQRVESDASYSVSHHVDVLIAMMGEARILRVAHMAHYP